MEKIIYESWQEDPGRKDWGRPGHSHCVQPYTWHELVDGYKDKYIPYKMGGLGKRLEPGGYETWVCLLDDHPCGDPHYCWVYHETDKVFTAWGTNTELGLQFKHVPRPVNCDKVGDIFKLRCGTERLLSEDVCL